MANLNGLNPEFGRLWSGHQIRTIEWRMLPNFCALLPIVLVVCSLFDSICGDRFDFGSISFGKTINSFRFAVSHSQIDQFPFILNESRMQFNKQNYSYMRVCVQLLVYFISEYIDIDGVASGVAIVYLMFWSHAGDRVPCGSMWLCAFCLAKNHKRIQLIINDHVRFVWKYITLKNRPNICPGGQNQTNLIYFFSM